MSDQRPKRGRRFRLHLHREGEEHCMHCGLIIRKWHTRPCVQEDMPSDAPKKSG